MTLSSSLQLVFVLLRLSEGFLFWEESLTFVSLCLRDEIVRFFAEFSMVPCSLEQRREGLKQVLRGTPCLSEDPRRMFF